MSLDQNNLPPIFDQFVNAQNQIRIAETNLAFWKKQQKALQESIMQWMAENEVKNMQVAGQTVYIWQKTWCSIDNKDPQALAAIADCAEVAGLVKQQVNAMDLTKHFKEVWGENLEKAPASLLPFLKITEEVQIRSREN